jgi:hypothetical protein
VRASLRRRLGRLALAAAAVAALGAGIAYAAIPDAAGVIHGCYRTSLDDEKGQLRVVSEAENCRNNETPIQWSQTGPAGPPGPPGADGADGEDGEDGEDGVSPTVAQLAPGDPNCPEGGAAITDSAGTTAYVCSGSDGEDGEPFSGTFTSPNGEYTLSVTDAGIVASGDGSTIALDGSGIRIETGADPISIASASSIAVDTATNATVSVGGVLAAQVGGNANVAVGGSLTTQVTANATLGVGGSLDLETVGNASITVNGALAALVGGAAALDAGTSLELRAGVVRIQPGAGCRPAARDGDPVAGGTIAGGSATVCIG